ncbi:oligosaccharide flippase family protein [Pontimicrobium sp. MEBiC06410]
MSIKTKISNFYSNNILFKKGIKDSLLYALSIILGRGLSILVFPYLAIKLSLEDVAKYDIFLIGVNYIQLFLILGIDSGIAIRIADNKSDKKKLSFYYTISIVILAITSIVLCLLTLIIYFVTNLGLFLLIILLIQGILMSFQYLSYNYFKWLGESKKASLLMSLGHGLGVSTGVVLLLYNNTFESFLIGIILGNCIGFIVSLYLTKSFIKISLNKETALESIRLLKLSIPFFFNSLLNQSYKSIDRFIILYFLTPKVLGIYSLLIRTGQLFILGGNVILSAFQAITFLNYKSKEGVKLYNQVLRFNYTIIGFVIVLISLLLFFSVSLVPKLDGINNYAFLFPLVLCNLGFIALRSYGGFSYYAHTKTVYITYITLVSLIVYVLLSVLLINFGIVGIVISGALVSCIGTYTFYYVGYKIESFNEDMKLIMLLSIFNLIVVFGLTYTLWIS